jgi:formate dehydrogenase subunit beta
VTLTLKNGDLTATLNQFFQDLLKKKVVDALIVPQAILSGQSYAQTLIKDASMIKHASPFLPIMMTNGAKVISSLTAWDPKQKLGVVLRYCEIRALIELAKFKQADLDSLTIIGVDCLGTVESSAFEEMFEGSKTVDIQAFLSDFLEDKQDRIRKSCATCMYPVPEKTDMNIGFIGVDLKKELYVRASDEIAEKLGLGKSDEPSDREDLISKIVEKRKKVRDEFLKDLKKRFKSIPDMLNEFARCKRCYNCRVECPICYCKECVFITNIFDHKPAQYLTWAERKGAMRLPADTLLFHLTRLNHMAISCVECGMCTSACPNDLPVYDLFQYVGHDVQALFEYVPGINITDEPPLNTYREKELDPQ